MSVLFVFLIKDRYFIIPVLVVLPLHPPPPPASTPAVRRRVQMERWPRLDGDTMLSVLLYNQVPLIHK